MPKVIIIGAGIIGLSSAYYLQEQGWDVTILEQTDLSDNCSFGNMGYLSPSHIIPLAAPGMIEQGLLWMFDSKSPFYIRPSLNRQLIDWGLRFMKYCNQEHVNQSTGPLLNLLLLSKGLFEEWSKAGQMDFDLQQKGCLMYYQTSKKEKAELEAAALAEKHGLTVKILDKAQIHAMEPDVRPNVAGGVWYKDDAHLDPAKLMRQLPSRLEQSGVTIIKEAKVTGFEQSSKHIKNVLYQKNNTTHSVEADLVVLAAGSWSPELARLANTKIPLMPGKGYSMDVKGLSSTLNYPCILVEAKVALTPWADRLRIGSTMEIGPINNHIMLKRAQGILEAVPRFLPKFQEDPVFNSFQNHLTKAPSGDAVRDKVWFGFRPVSADGMPIIGYASSSDNLIIATGHAMLGLSLGPGTGKLVAELANNSTTSIPIQAFSVQRFS